VHDVGAAVREVDGVGQAVDHLDPVDERGAAGFEEDPRRPLSAAVDGAARDSDRGDVGQLNLFSLPLVLREQNNHY
jgi:hypothetical protein